MSNQVVFIQTPFSVVLYAELNNGIIRAGAKRDITIYDMYAIPIAPEWQTYTKNTKFMYIHSSGKSLPATIKLINMTKVRNTGYVIPVFEITDYGSCDITNDLSALMNVVSSNPRQPTQCIAPPRAIAPTARPKTHALRKMRRDSTDSTKCVYKESLVAEPKRVVFSK